MDVVVAITSSSTAVTMKPKRNSIDAPTSVNGSSSDLKTTPIHNPPNFEQRAVIPSLTSSSIEWLGSTELGYVVGDDNDDDDNNNSNDRHQRASHGTVCFYCQATPPSPTPSGVLSKCAKCRIAAYCNKQCQTLDWKRHKKHVCASYQRLQWIPYGIVVPSHQPRQPNHSNKDSENATDGGDGSFPSEVTPTEDTGTQHHPAKKDEEENAAAAPSSEISSLEAVMHHRKILSFRKECDKATVRNELLGKMRLYVCPYAVHHTRMLGNGFLLLQCTQTLVNMSLGLQQNAHGHYLSQKRSIICHFLTMGEFDVEVCREDFELATLRNPLQQALQTYDSEHQVVLMMRFRCGHLAVGIAPLVPDYTVCQQLGQQYFASSGTDPLQLDLDGV